MEYTARDLKEVERKGVIRFLLALSFFLFGVSYSSAKTEDPYRDERIVTDCLKLYEAFKKDPGILGELRIAEISCDGFVIDSGRGIRIDTGEIVDRPGRKDAGAYVRGSIRAWELKNAANIDERPFKLKMPIAISNRSRLAEPENRAAFSPFRGTFQGVAICMFADKDKWKAGEITEFPLTYFLTLPLIEDFKKFVAGVAVDGGTTWEGAKNPFQLCALAEANQMVPKKIDFERSIRAQKGYSRALTIYLMKSLGEREDLISVCKNLIGDGDDVYFTMIGMKIAFPNLFFDPDLAEFLKYARENIDLKKLPGEEVEKLRLVPELDFK